MKRQSFTRKTLLLVLLPILTQHTVFAEIEGNMARYAGNDNQVIYSKNYKGYTVTKCHYPKGRIDFCTPKTLNDIFVATEHDKNRKPLFLNKYLVYVTDSADKKLSGVFIVDVNTKKVFTSPYEFDYKTPVSYNTKGKPEIYISAPINSDIYGGGWGSPKDPIKLIFDTKENEFYPKMEF